MKTNIKILTITAGIVLVFAAFGLWLLRVDIIALQQKVDKVRTYTPVQVSPFTSVQFKGNWKAIVRQGKDFNVQVALPTNSLSKAVPQTVNGILLLELDSVSYSQEPVYVKITLPTLTELRADGGSEIQMENFTSDSVRVILKGSGKFTGFSNTIKKATYNVSGETTLVFKDDGM